jgi:hypothetical protein
MSGLRRAAAWAITVLSVPAGIGFLYATRTAGALAVGPSIHGALPLQQLARGESQPLLRMLVAWIPAGVVAGLALGAVGRHGRLTSLLIAGATATVLLLCAGAAADAVAVSETVWRHVLPQLQRAGTWIAVACMLTGSAAGWRASQLRSVAAASVS